MEERADRREAAWRKKVVRLKRKLLLGETPVLDVVFDLLSIIVIVWACISCYVFWSTDRI